MGGCCGGGGTVSRNRKSNPSEHADINSASEIQTTIAAQPRMHFIGPNQGYVATCRRWISPMTGCAFSELNATTVPSAETGVKAAQRRARASLGLRTTPGGFGGYPGATSVR